MAFCPVCKNEYREGITICHDCKVPLVEDLNNGPAPVIYGEREQLEEILQFCKEKGLTTGFITYNEESGSIQLYFERDELEEATKVIRAFFMKKEIDRLAVMAGIDPKEMTPEMARELQLQERKEMEDMRRAERSRGIGTSYVDKRSKAAEYKSSSLVLSFVGGVGIFFLILLYVGAIPALKGWRTNYMFMGVMFFLFLIFVITGFVTFTKVGEILEEAEKEEDFIRKVKNVMEIILTKDIIDQAVASADPAVTQSEEELYFKRVDYMETVLKEKYPDMDSDLFEKLLDERYCELYENSEDNDN